MDKSSAARGPASSSMAQHASNLFLALCFVVLIVTTAYAALTPA